MNVKKVMFALAGVVMSCALLAGNSFAATATWAACTPTQVGHQDGFVRVGVSGCNIDPTGGLGYMTLSDAGVDQMMATILTAISLDKPIAIGADGTSSNGYKVATAVYISK